MEVRSIYISLELFSPYICIWKLASIKCLEKPVSNQDGMETYSTRNCDEMVDQNRECHQPSEKRAYVITPG